MKRMREQLKDTFARIHTYNADAIDCSNAHRAIVAAAAAAAAEAL